MSAALKPRAEQADPASVISKAALRAAEHLGLRNATLARVLGLSEASVSRLKSHTYLIETASKTYELAVLLIRLFRGLDAITGGDAASARSWMVTPNAVLQNKPIDLVISITGLMHVVQYVDASRARL